MNEKQFKQSIPDWTAAIKLDRGPLRPRLGLSRCIARVKSGDYQLAMKEAQAIESSGVRNDMLYPLGLVYSLLSRAVADDGKLKRDERTQRSQTLAARAVGYLKRAQVSRQLKSPQVDELRTDKDFDPLRKREDFKQLLKLLSNE